MDTAFPFGANWAKFMAVMDDDRIAIATRSVQQLIGLERLDGLRVLDIGSGSGLFSLAARRLGADVVSFDVDTESVACTEEMKRRYAVNDPHWTIRHGSVLDQAFMAALGAFDVVYAWGSLHHTGDLWRAMEATITRVKPHGRLCVSLYNDRGRWSRVWWQIKRLYQHVPTPLRPLYVAVVIAPMELRQFIYSPLGHLRSIRQYSRNRGMSAWRDRVDWVGGFPFEPTTPKAVVDYCVHRQLLLYAISVSRTNGCNEYGFIRR